MKKLFLMFTAFGLITFTACSSDDDEPTQNEIQEFEGEWAYEEVDYESDEPEESDNDTTGSGNGSYNLLKVNLTGGNGTVEFTLDPNKTMPNGEVDFDLELYTVVNGDTLASTTAQISLNLFDEADFSIESEGQVKLSILGSETEMNYTISGNDMVLTKSNFDFDLGGGFGSSASGDLRIVLKRQ